MKVLLIQPAKPQLHKADGSREGRQAIFPLGLLYLAASAQQQGHQVEILDVPTEGFHIEQHIEDTESGSIIRVGLTEDDISTRISQADPDVVGISCLLSSGADEAYRCAHLAKAYRPNLPVVLGGAHVSAMPREALAQAGIDYVIIGEGEESFCELLACIEHGRSVEHIDGIAYHRDDEMIVRPKTRFISDVDNIPWPARHLIDLNRYVENYRIYRERHMEGFGHVRSVQSRRYTPMLTSRGCPYRCYYCAKEVVWGHLYRARSPESVVDEMEHLVREHAVEEIHFEDENWAGDPARAMAICREILRRGLHVTWSVTNGLALAAMSEELLTLMKEAGAIGVTMSLESGSDRVCRELIDKPLDREKAKRMIALIKSLDLDLFVCFMLGFPGETLDEVYQTVRLAEELDLDKFGFALVTPLPGTRLLEHCRKNRLLVDGFDRKRVRFSVGNIVTDEFNPSLLERIRREEYLRIHERRAAKNPSPLPAMFP